MEQDAHAETSGASLNSASLLESRLTSTAEAAPSLAVALTIASGPGIFDGPRCARGSAEPSASRSRLRAERAQAGSDHDRAFDRDAEELRACSDATRAPSNPAHKSEKPTRRDHK